MSIRQLSNEVAVCGQISPEDLEAIAELGFKTIVNNRPDHEVGAQLAHSVIEAKAKSLGLAIHYLPMEVGQPPQKCCLRISSEFWTQQKNRCWRIAAAATVLAKFTWEPAH